MGGGAGDRQLPDVDKGSNARRSGLHSRVISGAIAASRHLLYAGTEAELVVLELDDDGIRGCGIPIPWESGGTEELFPHVYGALLVEWVTAVYGARVESNGDFRWA